MGPVPGAVETGPVLPPRAAQGEGLRVAFSGRDLVPDDLPSHAVRLGLVKSWDECRCQVSGRDRTIDCDRTTAEGHIPVVRCCRVDVRSMSVVGVMTGRGSGETLGVWEIGSVSSATSAAGVSATSQIRSRCCPGGC